MISNLAANVIIRNPAASLNILQYYSEKEELTNEEKSVVLKYFGGMLLLASIDHLQKSYLVKSDTIFRKLAKWYDNSPFVVPLTYDQGRKTAMVSRLLYEMVSPDKTTETTATLTHLKQKPQEMILPDLTELDREILEHHFYTSPYEQLIMLPTDPNYLAVYDLKVKYSL